MSNGPVVVVTRPEGRQQLLVDRLESLNATVLSWPTFAIEPVAEGIDHCNRILADAEWLVFTSVNGVRHCPAPERWPDTIAVVGEITAAAVVEKAGKVPSVVSSTSTASGIIDAFRVSGDMAGKIVVFPRARDARPTVVEGLRALGATVIDPVVYEAVPLPVRYERSDIAVAAIVFMSQTAVSSFSQVVSETDLEWYRVNSAAICIGDTAAGAARAVGFRRVVKASSHNLDGIVSTTADYINKEL